MKRLGLLAVMTAVCGCVAGSSLAGGGVKNNPDTTFVLLAGSSGMAEVKLGKMAQERGASAAVKKFGEHMVMDHTKANKELLAIAKRKGMEVPAGMDLKHKAVMDKMAALQGPAFDKAYAQHMVMDHVEAVKLFENASTKCQDRDLKAFAMKTLPTLQEHLNEAKKLASTVGAGASSR